VPSNHEKIIYGLHSYLEKYYDFTLREKKIIKLKNINSFVFYFIQKIMNNPQIPSNDIDLESIKFTNVFGYINNLYLIECCEIGEKYQFEMNLLWKKITYIASVFQLTNVIKIREHDDLKNNYSLYSQTLSGALIPNPSKLIHDTEIISFFENISYCLCKCFSNLNNTELLNFELNIYNDDFLVLLNKNKKHLKKIILNDKFILNNAHVILYICNLKNNVTLCTSFITSYSIFIKYMTKIIKIYNYEFIFLDFFQKYMSFLSTNDTAFDSFIKNIEHHKSSYHVPQLQRDSKLHLSNYGSSLNIAKFASVLKQMITIILPYINLKKNKHNSRGSSSKEDVLQEDMPQEDMPQEDMIHEDLQPGSMSLDDLQLHSTSIDELPRSRSLSSVNNTKKKRNLTSVDKDKDKQKMLQRSFSLDNQKMLKNSFTQYDQNKLRSSFSLDNSYNVGGSSSDDKSSPADKSVPAGKSSSEDNPYIVGRSSTEDKPYNVGGSSTEDKPYNVGESSTEDKSYNVGGSTIEDKPYNVCGSSSEGDTSISRRSSSTKKDIERQINERNYTENNDVIKTDNINLEFYDNIDVHALINIYFEKNKFKKEMKEKWKKFLS
jgi:hypothetical protein